MTFDDLERLLRDRGDATIGAGCEESLVHMAERSLGVAFPSDLRDYLRRFGHLELGHFELFGLGDALPEYLNLVKVTESERTETGCPLRDDLVPLLNDGGGNLYCIGTTGAEAGSVFFWDHERGPDQAPDTVAPSLTDWLAELLRELNGEG
jgi:cell wall assembly regulator SMI1